MHTLTISEPYKNILLAITNSNYELSATFMRLQEFFESPFETIRNQYFSREYFEDLYAAKYGNFTYYQDWAGFNVPGDIINDFFEIFKYNLSFKEINLFLNIKQFRNSFENIYLVGVTKKHRNKNRFLHELCHAIYYLNKKYKDKSDKLIKNMPKELYLQLITILKNWGYTKEVLDDEINAYLSTSDNKYLQDSFFIDTELYKEIISMFKYNFETEKLK